MLQRRFAEPSKYALIAIGVATLSFAAYKFERTDLTLGLLALALFSVAVVPHLSLTLPRSRFAISFSDAVILVAFLIYGWPAAVTLAALEMGANCLYLRAAGFPFGRLMIPTNISMSAVSTAAACLVGIYSPHLVGELELARTQDLITLLGLMAITQFAVSSTLAAMIQAMKDGTPLFATWRRDCFSSSMSQIVGSSLAGLYYKLLGFGDLKTALITMIGVAVAYLTYRFSINEINNAIAQVEVAEREKSEIERERRHEAEKHAKQLTAALEQQEAANAALRKSRQDFKHAALHDSLTGLANRVQLGDILSSLIRAYRDDPSQNFHVLFIDIRRFKNINDSLGHPIGDKVLMIAAKRFLRIVSSKDTVARLGGDEFAIILRDLSTVGKAQKVARRIANSISQPFSLSGNRISVGVNIGIAPCDTEYETPEDILRDADIAMHFAKEKNIGAAVFSRDLRERFLERAQIELDLRHALDRNELQMHYQPIVALRDGGVIGFEALLRWRRDNGMYVPPAKFIPIAEESGLILPITNWILLETCRQLAAWRRISHSLEDLIVSVNISSKHLAADDLVDDVELALEASGLPPEALKLEITESTAMENAEHTINVLNRLKHLGVKLSIDDFGTGYSSLSYLHRLPFDTLKIDRSFVSRVGHAGEDSEVLQTIVSLAKNLKMKVIAEGIETESQLHVLRNLGCDYGQGYLISRPLTRESAEKLIYEGCSFDVGAKDALTQRTDNNDIDAEASLPVF
ncbi:MAG: putative bifunctional diguanylate cyclase/phosphodiesterase [Pyrinomonadaceae bacterium]